jgi:hypothetical protein
MKLVIRSKKKRKCFVKKSLKRRRFLKKKRNRKKRWKLFFLTPLLSTYGDSLYLVLFIKKTCKKNEEIKRILKSFWDFYRNLVRIKTNSPNNFEVFRRYIGLLKLFLTIKENYYENEKFVDNFWSFYKDKEKYQSKARPKFP